MKKIFLLASLFCAMGMSAQTVTVTVGANNDPVSNGSVIAISDAETEWIEDGELTFQPNVKVTVSDDAELAVTLQNTGTYDLQFCWPSNCKFVRPGDSVTNMSDVTGGVANNMQIHCDVYGIEDPASISAENPVQTEGKLTIIVDGDDENAFEFTLQMIYPAEANSVDEIAVENAAPEYYSLQGVRVANPTPGIYVCKKGNKVSKVVVR